MSQRNFSDGQELIYEDFNAIPKALLRSVYDQFAYELSQRKSSVFFEDSLKVTFGSASSVIVKKGLGFMLDTSVASPDHQYKPLVVEVDLTVSLPAPDNSFGRKDLVCATWLLEDELTALRKFKNASTFVITNQTFVLQQKYTKVITVVQGVASASPVAPSVPTGYVKLAELQISAVTGLINAAAITDSRSLMPIGSNATIDTTSFIRLTQNASYNLKSILAEIDLILPKALNTATIANNQVVSADLGLTFDTASVKSVTLAVEIMRQTSSSELRQMGQVTLIYNTKTLAWDLIPQFFGDDTGVELSIVLVSGTTWKVQYTSSNVVGTSYVGTLKHQIRSSF